LRGRAITLAGALIELAGLTPSGLGEAKAAQVLDDGRAWAKFQRICEAQGGMRVPPSSQYRRGIISRGSGRVEVIDNRRIAKLAKLAGAPDDKAAGVELHVKLGEQVIAGQPLCTVHAEAPGELTYALDYAAKNESMFDVQE
jgi:thymidine phosphorylase